MSREKRGRDLNVVQTLKDRQNLHKFVVRKAEQAVRGEKSAQKRFSEAEGDMKIRNWEQRNSDTALYETANEWADQAQREKIKLLGDLEMRNRLFRENHEKD